MKKFCLFFNFFKIINFIFQIKLLNIFKNIIFIKLSLIQNFKYSNYNKNLSFILIFKFIEY